MEWVEARGKDKLSDEANASMEAMKLEEQRLKNERLRGQVEHDKEKIKIIKGQYIPRDEVENQMVPLIAEWQAYEKDRDIDLSNWAPGRSTGEIRVHQDETRDELFRKIRDGMTTFINQLQNSSAKALADEKTSINMPGQGRPKEATSARAKKEATKARKKATKK